MSANKTNQEELAQLEAERDRLLSMIAYHNGPFYRRQPRSPAQPWLLGTAVVSICVLGVTILAGVFAGQISALIFPFVAAALPLFAYILTRKITVFGTPLPLGDIVGLFFGGTGRPAGEQQVRQSLADCEARIMELKDGRS